MFTKNRLYEPKIFIFLKINKNNILDSIRACDFLERIKRIFYSWEGLIKAVKHDNLTILKYYMKVYYDRNDLYEIIEEYSIKYSSLKIIEYYSGNYSRDFICNSNYVDFEENIVMLLKRSSYHLINYFFSVMNLQNRDILEEIHYCLENLSLKNAIPNFILQECTQNYPGEQ